jgi:hypothetical protein
MVTGQLNVIINFCLFKSTSKFKSQTTTLPAHWKFGIHSRDEQPAMPSPTTPPRDQHSSLPVASENDFDHTLSRLDDTTSSALIRYFQNLEEADTPASPITPKYHTGKLPNSKAADGKPRLLLMGQRRQVALPHCAISWAD